MKNTREIATEYRMGYWAEIMRQRTESGLSIKAYCEREGMHVNRYHYWQRRLRAAAAKELIPAKKETSMPVPAGWTQVKAAEESDSQSESESRDGTEVTIEIGKCRMRVKEGTNTELVRKVCKVLVEIC